jgi:hypothetical protein
MRLLLSVLLCLLPAISSVQMTDDSMSSSRRQLETQALASIVVLHMSDDVLTRIAVTPDLKRKWAEVKVTLDDTQKVKLQSMIHDTSAKPSAEKSDLRWGILFYDPLGNETGSIFVNRFGKTGYINSQAVTFSQNLRGPLHQLIHAKR